MEKIAMPEAYKEKGWAKSIQDDEGNLDITKVLSKIDGQETLLGKKHIPGKDATAEQVAEFNANIVKNYEDGDYSDVLGDADNKAEMIVELKKQGFTPAQAKYIAGREMVARDSVKQKEFSVDEFQTEFLKRVPDEKARAKAKAVLVKTGKWDALQNLRNESALDTLEFAAKVGVDYDVDDEPGKGGSGDGNAIQSNNKGYCQEYVNEIDKLESEGMNHADALAICKKKYGVE